MAVRLSETQKKIMELFTGKRAVSSFYTACPGWRSACRALARKGFVTVDDGEGAYYGWRATITDAGREWLAANEED